MWWIEVGIWEEKRRKYLENLEERFRVKQNARIARRFINYIKNQSLSIHTLYRYAESLVMLDNFVKKSFDKITREDLEDFLAYLSDNYTPTTVDNVKIYIKRFYKWFLGKDEEYPPLVKWIKKSNHRPRLERSQLITENEFKKMVQVCKNPRDRAILWILYETGIRVSELTSLKIGDFEMVEDGLGLITCRGKTGSRSIPVALSLPDLLKWLEKHPCKDDPSSPLFITNRGNPMSGNLIQAIVKKYAEKAGIKKRVYPHLLRHSRATHLASELKEPVLRQWFGWSQGSRTPQVYLHLASRDLIKSYAQYLGLKSVQVEEPMKPKTCPRCGEINPPDADFCSKCGHPFNEKFIAEKMRTISRLEDELRKRDEAIKKLQEQIEKLNLQFFQVMLALQSGDRKLLEQLPFPTPFTEKGKKMLEAEEKAEAEAMEKMFRKKKRK